MSQPGGLLGVVMDPIETIKPKKDSTLAMLLAAQRRRMADRLLSATGSRGPRRRAARVTARASRSRDDTSAGSRSASPGTAGWRQLDALLMRKDPPFDMEYIYTTYILELAEKRGLLVVNKPVEPARHQREGLHGVVPAVHAAEPRHALARRPCSRS